MYAKVSTTRDSFMEFNIAAAPRHHRLVSRELEVRQFGEVVGDI